MPLLGSVPGSQGVAVDGGQRFALCQPDRDQVQGLMNPSDGRNPPARAIASRSGTAQ
jgi:hypothetical protein